MTKIELINAIAAEAEISKVDAKRALDGIAKILTDALCKGDRVALSGIGSFAVVRKAPRMGRNPRTGAKIKIPAKNSVKFTAAAELTTKVQ